MNDAINKVSSDSIARTDSGSAKRGRKQKRKRKFNGKGRYDKGSQVKRNETSIRAGKQFNDISFYTKNPTITKAFASIPFNYINGNRVGSGDGNNNFSNVSIMSFNLEPVFDSKKADLYSGAVSDAPTILEQVSTIVYTAMRRANSGSSNQIEPVDVIISNLLASIDIYANAAAATRMFNVANLFSWKNRMIPREIFKHMGYDYDDFIANQANYRGRYNTIVAQAKTIRTLASFPFLNAYFAEFVNLFKDEDADTGREQIMFVNKVFHFIYDPIGNEAFPGGMVRHLSVRDMTGSSSGTYQSIMTGYDGSTTTLKFSSLLNIMQKQIDALITDTDFNLIQADIEKAFGEQSGYLELDSVKEYEALKPIYSGEFATMLHNANVYSNPLLASLRTSGAEPFNYSGAHVHENTIYQDKLENGRTRIGYEMHGRIIAASFDQADGNTLLLDTNVDIPTPEDIVTMTRYKTTLAKVEYDHLPQPFRPSSAPPNGYTYAELAVGSNFIVYFNAVTIMYDNGVGTVDVIRNNGLSNMLSPSSPETLGYFLPLKYGPMFVYRTGTNNRLMTLFNVNNPKQLTKSELENIHLSCFLSLWDLPNRTNI